MDLRTRIAVLAGGAMVVWCCGMPAAAADAPRVEDVAFTAKCDGSTQHYVLIFPANFHADQTYPLLAALHGHGSDRWQFVRDNRDECRAARDTAAAHNMLYVSPDYRAKTSWMGPQAEADLLQILDELKARYHIGKVVVSGGSMGGTSALTFAALHPDRVDGVVALNGAANHLEYENFQDAIRASFGGAKAEIPAEYKRRSAEYWPERLRMPLAVTLGGQDHVVPPDSVRRLVGVVQKLQPAVLLIERATGGHSTNYDDSRAAYEFVLGKAL